MEHTNTLCGQNAEILNGTVGGIYIFTNVLYRFNCFNPVLQLHFTSGQNWPDPITVQIHATEYIHSQSLLVYKLSIAEHLEITWSKIIL
jgi:hypothetical protein